MTPKSNLPSVFRDMNMCTISRSSSNHDKAYWQQSEHPIQTRVLPSGYVLRYPVQINEVTATAVKRIKYSPDYFTFGDVQHDKDTVKDLGLPV
ncbi:glucan biosynthesis protein [Shigella boydii]